jgi:hypothetical protein
MLRQKKHLTFTDFYRCKPLYRKVFRVLIFYLLFELFTKFILKKSKHYNFIYSQFVLQCLIFSPQKSLHGKYQTSIILYVNINLIFLQLGKFFACFGEQEIIWQTFYCRASTYLR